MRGPHITLLVPPSAFSFLLSSALLDSGVLTLRGGPGIKQLIPQSASPESRHAHFHTNKILSSSLLCTTRIESSRTKGKQVNKQNDVWTCHRDEGEITRIRRVYACKWKLIFFSFLTSVSGVWDWREQQEKETVIPRRIRGNVSKLFEEAAWMLCFRPAPRCSRDTTTSK